MKKALIIAIAMVLMAASVSFAIIAGSRHDLTATNFYTGAQVSACQFCHTPHLRNNPVVNGAPLWNRNLPTITYQVYGGGQTLAGTTVGQPGTNSKTCLSCHDGTIALGDILVGTDSTIAGTTGGGTASTITNGYMNNAINPVTGRMPGLGVGGDLRQEHPVGIQVIPGRAGLKSINAMQTAGARFYNVGGNWMMECATCHDPHETDTGYQPFLRMSYASICTDCHAY
ncbi:MAG: cytochrome c3 family protein [Thermodesulfovibrionales bacterium]|nr:cytochrome c3 family protein [Thermodesulfovibrionales bacterium]